MLGEIHMENLFNYATKELTQDAFLRWILANYNDNQLGEVAYGLLNKFCGLSYDEEITKLYADAQWNKVDIAVWITTSKDRKIALFIEDKTFSSEHTNQLERYNVKIDDIREYTAFKVFYKTAIIDEKELMRIKSANSKTSNPWQIYTINEIVELFNKFTGINNFVLQQYIDYVNEIRNAYNNMEKPQSSKSKIDFIKWTSYFKRVVIPKLGDFGGQIKCEVLPAGQYPYVCLKIFKSNYAKGIPFLEIRSRECLEDKFRVKLLCYGIPTEDIQQQSMLIKHIKIDGIFDTKRTIYNKKGRKENYPKQIGHSTEKNVCTTEQFVDAIKKYTQNYLIVMQDWK